MTVIPEIAYVKTAEGVHIAYQVVGDGPVDVLFVPGYASNLQWHWELPSYARFLERLASFSRLICVDRRGSGLSDRFSPDDLPPLEDLVADLEAVLDEVGSKRAVVFGAEDGGLTCCLLAATRPERVSALILYAMDPGGGSGWSAEQSDAFWRELFQRVDREWGTREFSLWDIGWANPSRLHDEAFVGWHSAHLRLSASPATAEALLRMYVETDVRGILPSISAPTLVLHRIDDRLDPVQEARETAAAIPDSKLVELPGDDHYWVVGGEDLLDEVQEFLTGDRPPPETDRMLATVLFTDIVGSTERAAELGDRAWGGMVEHHHGIVRGLLARHRGAEVDTAGDGFFATFDGPARAVRCAKAIAEAVRPLGIEIRAGVHTGEVESIDGKVGGIAVSIGARIAGCAGPSQVLTSSTVKDLVAGSGLAFEDAGEHELKGVPDRWRLYRVSGVERWEA